MDTNPQFRLDARQISRLSIEERYDLQDRFIRDEDERNKLRRLPDGTPIISHRMPLQLKLIALFKTEPCMHGPDCARVAAGQVCDYLHKGETRRVVVFRNFRNFRTEECVNPECRFGAHRCAYWHPEHRGPPATANKETSPRLRVTRPRAHGGRRNEDRAAEARGRSLHARSDGDAGRAPNSNERNRSVGAGRGPNLNGRDRSINAGRGENLNGRDRSDDDVGSGQNRNGRDRSINAGRGQNRNWRNRSDNDAGRGPNLNGRDRSDDDAGRGQNRNGRDRSINAGRGQNRNWRNRSDNDAGRGQNRNERSARANRPNN